MAHSIRAAVPNKNDEIYTPPKLVEIILPYILSKDFGKGVSIKSRYTAWCPFDTADSEFVIQLEKAGYKVIHSHISEGKDFFTYQPENWDFAVSNPPFSMKLDVIKRLVSLGKPFAMLMNIMALNYQEVGYYFADNPVQMLIPDKRVSFNGHASSFCSGYICKDILPRDLMFCHMTDNNVGSNFEPAKMFKRNK